MSIWIIFKLLGSLALLMFGMKSMSEALQKMAGPQLRHVLGAMTTNRFTGMLTGMLVGYHPDLPEEIPLYWRFPLWLVIPAFRTWNAANDGNGDAFGREPDLA